MTHFGMDGITGKSPICGQGVFAARDIRKGEMICRFRGGKISIAEMERCYLDDNDARITCDPLQVSEHVHIRLEEPYVYVNHSCDPNAGMRDVCTLVALKFIKKGEEITYDYSSVEWTSPKYTQYDTNEWPMHCLCNSPQCRETIVCFPYLPKAIRRKYLRSNIVPNFILRKLLLSRERQRCSACEKILGTVLDDLRPERHMAAILLEKRRQQRSSSGSRKT